MRNTLKDSGKEILEQFANWNKRKNRKSITLCLILFMDGISDRQF